ncbi:vanadium-dependent haloperoxidase [Aquimarina pacifica]|uniref:vanadium-dependent haloperoxidase n=1 Tax=Aquimarina pacifica TaxID=1296415 RepID=UPI0004B82DFA|nr:vanadium-dependent haloperoxidase [Aquimarina pacifica]
MKHKQTFHKNIYIKVSIMLAFLLTSLGCKKDLPVEKIDLETGYQLIEWNKKLTEVMISDVFTPPVASRIYAYSNIAAYEAIQAAEGNKNSLSQKLNKLSDIPTPQNHHEINATISGVIAFATAGKSLVYNSEAIEKHKEDFISQLEKTEIDTKTLQNSINYGEIVGTHILDWANTDGYHQRSALSRYQLKLNDPGSWKPTPPDYMEAIEPNWNTLRTFVLDSANQFLPEPPTAFDTIPSSQFYQETIAVYDAVKNLSPENLEKAKFWDCNPNISFTKGHIMYYKQQISPGGHWMMIACQVIKEQKLSSLQASETLSKLGITIADAFISCWSEKYKSSLIRPETYINTYIDQNWKPILQTPAFPEYTSGHSVASSSAAIMLTHLFGNNYKFTDSTEIPYGLPARSFDSFTAAAEEAAISRLYGGIHYMPAIENGVKQGTQIGRYIVNNIGNNHRNSDK